jgi:hypothetical protein
MGIWEISIKAVKSLHSLAKLIRLEERRLIFQLRDEALQCIYQLLGAPFVKQCPPPATMRASIFLPHSHHSFMYSVCAKVLVPQKSYGASAGRRTRY